MSEAAYTVRLPVFEGPLDLLLHLIKHHKLDITAVSLAAVTEQYLKYVEQLEEIDPRTLAEFLTVAAQLMLIKSRQLLPQPEPEEMPEEEDPAEALARRLEEYQQFKQVAAGLRDREDKGLRGYGRVTPAPGPTVAPRLDLSDTGPADLAKSLQALLEQRPRVASVDKVVRPLRITVGEKIEMLRKALTRRKSVRFHQLIRRASSRQEVIVTFLAMLEMIKQHRLVVHQERLFGEIMLERVSSGPPEPVDEEESGNDT